MTAQKIIEKASLMLGFSGANEQRIQENALTVVNAIYAELFFLENDKGFKEINDFSDEINLSERILNDVMPYGVASLLAFALGDIENQNHYGQIYNLKRKKHVNTQLTDVLPCL